MRAFVTCNGEQEQMIVFQQQDLLNIFSYALIDFGKIAASCSGIHQSSDISLLFRVIKTKSHAVETRKYRSPLINTALVTILASCGFSVAIRSKISDGLQKVVSTIRAVMTAEMIVAGYEKTG